MAKKPDADAQTLALIDEVKKRKKEIAKAEKPNWVTNCSFAYTEGSSQITNLQVESDVTKLLKIGAFLRTRAEAYDATAKDPNLEDVPKFKWDGFTVDEWFADL